MKKFNRYCFIFMIISFTDFILIACKGSSIKTIEAPVTATIMMRDFKSSNKGIINCKDGNTNNCRTTIDSRLVYKF